MFTKIRQSTTQLCQYSTNNKDIKLIESSKTNKINAKSPYRNEFQKISKHLEEYHTKDYSEQPALAKEIKRLYIQYLKKLTYYTGRRDQTSTILQLAKTNNQKITSEYEELEKLVEYYESTLAIIDEITLQQEDFKQQIFTSFKNTIRIIEYGEKLEQKDLARIEYGSMNPIVEQYCPLISKRLKEAHQAATQKRLKQE